MAPKMDSEFLLQNNDPTHFHLTGRYNTTVSSAAGDSLVGCTWKVVQSHMMSGDLGSKMGKASLPDTR